MIAEKTVGQWLEQLAASSESTEQDSNKMQNLLHRVGFSQARVVLGIAYLDGHGTIEAPPVSIHSVAKMLVDKVTSKVK